MNRESHLTACTDALLWRQPKARASEAAARMLYVLCISPSGDGGGRAFNPLRHSSGQNQNERRWFRGKGQEDGSLQPVILSRNAGDEVLLRDVNAIQPACFAGQHPDGRI